METAHAITTRRPDLGYSAAKYDESMGETPKTLRRQFGRFYDVKKARNTSVAAKSLVRSSSDWNY